VTREAGPCDTSHLAGYHETVRSQCDSYVGCGGEPFLFAYEDGELRIAIPLLRRPIDRIVGLESFRGWYDATSAYGYPGLLVNHRNGAYFRCGDGTRVKRPEHGSDIPEGDVPEENTRKEKVSGESPVERRSRFQRTFLAALRELGIVSFFGRANPLIPELRNRFVSDPPEMATGPSETMTGRGLRNGRSFPEMTSLPEITRLTNDVVSKESRSGTSGNRGSRDECEYGKKRGVGDEYADRMKCGNGGEHKIRAEYADENGCGEECESGGEAFWYHGIADVRRTGRTVAMDLTLPESDQYRQMRRDTRARLRRAHDAGVTVRRVIPETDGTVPSTELTRFMELYNGTMRSVGASAGYFFDRSYYETLFRSLGPSHTALLFAEHEGIPIAGAIFLLSGIPDDVRPGSAIIQYHLSGSVTDERTRRYGGGTRPILDDMRRWGSANGYRWLHMGGGVGGRGPGDSLFDFKAGFSRHDFDFLTVRLIVDAAKYARLVDARPTSDSGFFPRYRGNP
ncbi:MAG: hypothetical protein Q4C47_09455, partial [Planctomycetia bacterium]|nr:hypothetical protein [Planctomycetia bacterium]